MLNKNGEHLFFLTFESFSFILFNVSIFCSNVLAHAEVYVNFLKILCLSSTFVSV